MKIISNIKLSYLAPFLLSSCLLLSAATYPDRGIHIVGDRDEYHFDGDHSGDIGIYFYVDLDCFSPVHFLSDEDKQPNYIPIRSDQICTFYFDGSTGPCSLDLINKIMTQGPLIVHEANFVRCEDSSSSLYRSTPLFKIVDALKNQRALKVMYFRICDITSKTLASISNCDTLTTLTFNQCSTDDSPEAWDSLTKLKLKAIFVEGGGVKNMPEFLSKLKTLEYIGIHGQFSDTKDYDSLSKLGSLQHLRRLSLTNVAFSVEFMKQISDLHNIEYLTLRSTRPRNLDSEGIKILSNMARLKCLSLDGFTIDKQVISDIQHTGNLIIKDSDDDAP